MYLTYYVHLAGIKKSARQLGIFDIKCFIQHQWCAHDWSRTHSFQICLDLDFCYKLCHWWLELAQTFNKGIGIISSLGGPCLNRQKSTNMCFDNKLNSVKLTTYIISHFVPEFYVQHHNPIVHRILTDIHGGKKSLDHEH
jgi:hypothetical protein